MTNYVLKENDKILQIIYSPDDDIVNNIKKSLKENQTFEKTNNNEIINEETPQELAQTELQELENCFNYYDLQAIQYSRAIRLGLSFDKDINVLDSQAIEKACRIKELRGLI